MNLLSFAETRVAVFDASFIMAMLEPARSRPRDPTTGGALASVPERMALLLLTLQRRNEKIVIPTPALCEFLVFAEDAAPKYVAQFAKSKNFKIADFGRRAAIEAATRLRADIEEGDKRGGSPDNWQKVKFDRQIAAITIAEGDNTIYTSDGSLQNLARKHGLQTVDFYELPIPTDTMPPLLRLLQDEPKPE